MMAPLTLGCLGQRSLAVETLTRYSSVPIMYTILHPLKSLLHQSIERLPRELAAAWLAMRSLCTEKIGKTGDEAREAAEIVKNGSEADSVENFE